jgi:glutamate-1-semialdehyde aminotransferase
LDGHLLPGLSPTGIPRQLAHTALPFTYNRLDQLQSIVRQHGTELAAVIMEPTRTIDPNPGFLEGVRELCDKSGAVLVFDEITSGFRFHMGGVHLKYGIAPDVAVFAKALSNGHPMAAVVGVRDVMEAATRSFISSTYWTESLGPSAALATIEKMSKLDLPAHLERIGLSLRQGLSAAAERHGLPLKVLGHAPLTSFAFEHPKNTALGTLFTVRMMERGILAGSSFYASLAHQPSHVAQYLEAADPIYAELAAAIEADDIESRIGGLVRNSGFTRLA